MLEKIINKKTDPKITVPQVQRKIARHLTELKKKYGKEDSGIEYHWDRSRKKLIMKSRYFNGEIDLYPGGLDVCVDIPFLLLPFRGRVVAEVTKEVDELLKFEGDS